MSADTLSALYIGNFKAFADTEHIPLKPITLIFGPNSAGKSSILHALAALKGNRGDVPRRAHKVARDLNIGQVELGGRQVDLGGFGQFVNGNDTTKTVELGYELSDTEARPRAVDANEPRRVVVRSRIGLAAPSKSSAGSTAAVPRVVEIMVELDGAEWLRASYHADSVHAPAGLLCIDAFDAQHPLSQAIVAKVSRRLARYAGDDPKPSRFRAQQEIEKVMRSCAVRVNGVVDLRLLDPVEVEDALSQAAERLNIKIIRGFDPTGLPNPAPPAAPALATVWCRLLNLQLGQIHERWDATFVHYLGPYRELPPRGFQPFEEDPEFDSQFDCSCDPWRTVLEDDEVRERVNQWLEGHPGQSASNVKEELMRDQRHSYAEAWMKTPYRLVADRFQVTPELIGATDQSEPGLRGDDLTSAMRVHGTQSMARLRLWDVNKHATVSLQDVGFGVSQILPVLVTAYAAEYSLVIIEQPEIHLHPALQAELADVLIESALGDRQNTFLLETHSEHLILRLLRRIREQKLAPRNVAVLYVEPVGTRSRVRQLEVDANGDFIDEWPGGFFEESYRETFAGR